MSRHGFHNVLNSPSDEEEGFLDLLGYDIYDWIARVSLDMTSPWKRISSTSRAAGFLAPLARK